MHALRRDLCYAHEGQLRHRHHEDQTEQALCLTVVTNAIGTTEYLGLAAGDTDVTEQVTDRYLRCLLDSGG